MEAALVAATVVLAAATGVLAYFTRGLREQAKAARAEAERTRFEMREARRLSVRPRLAFDPHVPEDALGGVLLIRNVGSGPALNVRATVRFTGAIQGGVEDVREWSEESIVPGELHELHFPVPFNADLAPALTDPFAVKIEAKMHDLYGRPIDFTISIDISEWWRRAVDARERRAGRRKTV